MEITRELIRDFMNEHLRESLFESPVMSRSGFIYALYEYTGRQGDYFTLDEQIEIMRAVKKMFGVHAVFSNRTDISSGEEYRVIVFSVDPVNKIEWHAFLNTIHYRENTEA